MSELQVQTRNRSRSKTPFLRSSCDSEQCAHAGEEGHVHQHHEKEKTKKAPTVQTIIEEESTSSKSTKVKKAPPKTSDYSSDEPSPNNSLEKKVESSSKITSSTVVTKVQKKVTTKSGGSVSVTSSSSAKKEGFEHSWASPFAVTKSKEARQNDSNASFEKAAQLQTSTPIQKSSKQYVLNANGSFEEHIPYKEYREAGEYWKKYPKTDYTYSKLSPHRRELAPGEVGMPNMSRSSLEHHDSRVNYMVERDPAQEELIRRRYQAQYKQSRNVRDLAYDSQDEADSYTRLYTETAATYRTESWIRRVIVTIWTSIITFGGVVGRSAADESYLYATRISEEKGFFGRIASGISNAFITAFRKVYLLISTILFYDTCLLKSSKADNKGKKRFLLLLLLVLPLLSLTAWRQLEDEERHAYIQKAHNLLPLSAFSVRSFLAAADWRELLKLNPPSSRLPASLTKSLSTEEYDNILNHVNNYVQQLVDAKLQKENEKAAHEGELREEDVERIVGVINRKLEKEPLDGRWKEEIADLFSENDVLQSKLGSYIDGRVGQSSQEQNDVISRQQMVISELSNEIEFIRTTLHEKLSENEDLRYSIDSLQTGQTGIFKRLDEHDARFESLLAEIDAKLSSLNEKQFTLMNKQIRVTLAEVMGYKDAGRVEDLDLQNWVRNVFVAKEVLEARLAELCAQTNQAIKDEIDRSGVVLLKDISERIKTAILHAIETRSSVEVKSSLDEEEIKRIVKSVLAVYDADKTGLVDFALEPAGGQILSTRCTENYQQKSAQISFLGIPLWYPSNSPRTVISPNVTPGECWAFQGFPGFLVLQLNSLVYVSGFTLEHIPKSLTPNGRIDSAPRNFTVWGLEREKDTNPVLFGEYEYADNNAALQYFPVQNKSIKRPYDIVELRIESNHGHLQYTCLYRFRVHGKSVNNDAT